MKLAYSDSEALRLQLSTMEILAEKQAEELIMLRGYYKRLKNTRITSICVSGAGLVVGLTGYFLQKDEATKNIGSFMLGTGATALGCGLLTFTFTIVF